MNRQGWKKPVSLGAGLPAARAEREFHSGQRVSDSGQRASGSGQDHLTAAREHLTAARENSQLLKGLWP